MWTNIRAMGRESGGSMVETALAVPILVLLLMGVADIGMAFHSYLTVINAAREGARLAANGTADDAAIRAAVMAEAQVDAVDLSGATITVDPSPTRVSGNYVRVTVQLNYTTMFAQAIKVATIPLQASSAFRVR